MLLAEGLLAVLLSLVLLSFLLRHDYARTAEETSREFGSENHLITMEELKILPPGTVRVYILGEKDKAVPELPVPAEILPPSELKNRSLTRELSQNPGTTILYSKDPRFAAKVAA